MELCNQHPWDFSGNFQVKTTTENGRDAVPAVQNTNNTRYSRSKSTVHITCSSPRCSHSFSLVRSSSSGAGFTSSHDLSTPYCSAVTIMPPAPPSNIASTLLFLVRLG